MMTTLSSREVPWAIALPCLDMLGALDAGRPSPLEARLFGALPPRPTREAGSIVVIALRGFLLPHALAWGGIGLDAVSRMVRQAAADPSVAALILDLDSPGGSVFGVEEAAQSIHAATLAKPVVAVANPIAASAAYWLASQASELVVAPGGQIGSIGVVAIHDDLSKAAEKAGVRRSLIHAGRYKAEGHEFAPLDDSARAHLQGQVDGYFRKFLADVARGRRVDAATVRTRFGEGRMVMDDKAVGLGMVDRIGTLDATLARLTTRRLDSPSAFTEAARLRATLARALQSDHERSRALTDARQATERLRAAVLAARS